MDDVILYLKILKEEIRWIVPIGKYSPDFGSGEKYIFRSLVLEKSPYLALIQEIQFCSRTVDEIRVSEGFEFPLDAGANESIVSGYIDFGSFIHGYPR